MSRSFVQDEEECISQYHLSLIHSYAVLGFFNAVCQVYTTIIRGTPMMVQLLIMSMVIFANRDVYKRQPLP